MRISDIERYMKMGDDFLIYGNKKMLEKAEKELMRLGAWNDPWNKQRKKLTSHTFIRVWASTEAGNRPFFYYVADSKEVMPFINLSESKWDYFRHWWKRNWAVLSAAGIISGVVSLFIMVIMAVIGVPDVHCRFWGGVSFGGLYVTMIKYFKTNYK